MANRFCLKDQLKIIETIKELETKSNRSKKFKQEVGYDIDVLKAYFIEGKSSSQLEQESYSRGWIARTGRNAGHGIKRRMIQNIIKKYVPYSYDCRKKEPIKHADIRNELQIKRSEISKPTNCQKCGITSNYLELDHILPICFGGDNQLCNLQWLCRECHAAKTSYEKQIRKKVTK